MNIKLFVVFILRDVVSSLKSIQKIPSKCKPPSNPDLTFTPSDKTSFLDVVYPSSILDIVQPFYFNTDNDFEVLEPFSEDVKSSYKLLASIAKYANRNSGENINQVEINEVITNPVKDDEVDVSEKENIAEECQNYNKEDCIDSIVLNQVIGTETNTDSMLDNTPPNYDYNTSLPREIQNETCSQIPLYIKINIEVLKERSDKSKEQNVNSIANNLSFNNNEEKTPNIDDTEEKTIYSRNDSSEETNSSSEEHCSQLQDVKHSDFIKILSVMLLDLLNNTDNTTTELNTTSIENESFERNALESVDNLTKSESYLIESNLTDLIINDFENMLNLTETLRCNDEESVKDSKEDYFLDFLISLDSLCDNNNTTKIVGDNDFSHIKNISENFTP